MLNGRLFKSLGGEKNAVPYSEHNRAYVIVNIVSTNLLPEAMNVCSEFRTKLMVPRMWYLGVRVRRKKVSGAWWVVLGEVVATP